LAPLQDSVLQFSEGVVGAGRAWFTRVMQQGHEGVMAKHLGGPYRPGRRCGFWRKIKPRRQLPCVIIGYVPTHTGLASVLVAAFQKGTLRYVGEVTSGFRAADVAGLRPQLARRERSRPVVPCGKQARWVEPELYCLVQFQHWTSRGMLRGASFRHGLPAKEPETAPREATPAPPGP
jgi:bifunctional non-homologous end joining protein LigD